MTYFAVRISGKPADEEHHYGHGKVESVSALAETALLFVLSGVVIWEAAKRLLGDREPCGRGDDCGLRRDRRFDRGRFLPRPAALSRRRARQRARRWRPMRCISAPTCGRRSRCWSGLAACALGLPMGGFGRGHGRRAVRLPRRLAARPPHHRHADRHRAGGLGRTVRRIAAACPAWSRSMACGCGRSATSCSSRWWWRSAAPCRSTASRRSRRRSREAIRAEMPRAEVGVDRRAARARRRDRAGARHGDRAQPGARRASRHRARHRRPAFGLARSRGRPQARAWRRPRDRRPA